MPPSIVPLNAPAETDAEWVRSRENNLLDGFDS